MEKFDELDQRVTALEEQVTFLLKSRPGRQLKPIVVSEAGICGIDPERDSHNCPDSSLWRRSKGCKGYSCLQISSQYYKDYRKKKKSDGKDNQ